MPTLGLAPDPDEVKSKQEDEGDRHQPDIQEYHGVGTIVDVRAVSPGANPDVDVGSDEKAVVHHSGPRVAARDHVEEGDGEYIVMNSSNYDIVLSLRADVYYKRKIEKARDVLWGEANRGHDPSPKDTAQELLEELKREIEGWGGSIYRLTPGGNSQYKASDKEALKKIIADLNNGKKGRKAHSYCETSPNDGDDYDPSRQSPKKMPPPSEDDKDLILSWRDDSYKGLINSKVEQLLGGLCGRSIAAIASEEIKAVRRKGDRIFNLGKGMQGRLEMDDESAGRVMADRIEEKLVAARRNDDRVVIINKKNKKYEDAVVKGAKTLAEDKDKPAAGARAEAIGKMLMEEFKGAGAIHFFKTAKDDEETSPIEVLEKLTKDIQAEARFVHPASKPSLPNGGNHEDKAISSTRKRIIREGPFIHCSSREYLWDYIVSYLRSDLADYGLEVRRKVINQLDVWVARRAKSSTSNAGEPCDDLIGWEDILDETYLCGFYDDKILRLEQGRDVLKDAKILEDPYSIFGEELRRQRKRRKLEQGPLMEPLAHPREILAVEKAPEVEAAGPGNVLSVRSDRVPNPRERTEPLESPRGRRTDSRHTGLDVEASVMGCAAGGLVREVSKDTAQERDVGSEKRPSVPNETPTDGNVNIQLKSGINAVQGRDIDDGDATSPSKPRNEPAFKNSVQGRFIGTEPSNSSNRTKDNGTNLRPKLENDSDQGTKMTQQNSSSVHLSRVMEAADQVLQMYKHIKTKVLCAKKSMNGAHQPSNCSSGVSHDGSKKLALKVEFYGHLKRWLAQRGRVVELSDLNVIQNLMGRFESVIEEMEDLDNDEDDILCYTNVCERIIEECKRALQV